MAGNPRSVHTVCINPSPYYLDVDMWCISCVPVQWDREISTFHFASREPSAYGIRSRFLQSNHLSTRKERGDSICSTNQDINKSSLKRPGETGVDVDDIPVLRLSGVIGDHHMWVCTVHAMLQCSTNQFKPVELRHVHALHSGAVQLHADQISPG